MFENFKVIGIGDGGAELFGQLGLEIGAGHGMHSDDPCVVVEMSELVESKSSSISNKIIEVYRSTEKCDVQGYYDAGSTIVAGFEGIARWEKWQNHWPIARQGNYIIWGFNAPLAQMTDEGKQLFFNLLVNHNAYVDIPLSKALQKIDYIKTGRLADRLSNEFRRRVWNFQVHRVGLISATLTWEKSEHELMLLLIGPRSEKGYVGWKREDGTSPLHIEFEVTEDALLEGTDWEISVANFKDLGGETISFKLQITFPQA